MGVPAAPAHPTATEPTSTPRPAPRAPRRPTPTNAVPPRAPDPDPEAVSLARRPPPLPPIPTPAGDPPGQLDRYHRLGSGDGWALESGQAGRTEGGGRS